VIVQLASGGFSLAGADAWAGRAVGGAAFSLETLALVEADYALFESTPSKRSMLADFQLRNI
jgi:hypothetical protein